MTAGYSAYLLDYTRTHALSGGSREAASIITGATSAVPNSENTISGFAWYRPASSRTCNVSATFMSSRCAALRAVSHL